MEVQTIQTAINTVKIDQSAVGVKPLTAHTQYQVTGSLFHDNVQMGIIALTNDFPTDRRYLHAVFSKENNSFEFNSTMSDNGQEVTFSHLYFYSLLEITPGESEDELIPGYRFGPGDGNPGQLPASSGAVLKLEYANVKGEGELLKADSQDTILLPGEVIEFSAGFSQRVAPVKGHNWVDFKIITWENRPTIQAKAVIHFSAGNSGDELVGVIRKGWLNSGAWYNLGTLPTQHRNLNMFGLISPFVNLNVKDGFLFQLGDPQKDGSVKLQTV